jgi:hypothetical protein
MKTERSAEVRYQPRYCSFLRQHVWAIATKQPDGAWRIVNCLDKDEGCFSLECAFTTDHGEWPYREAADASPDQPKGLA